MRERKMSRDRMLGNPTVTKLAEIRYQQSVMKPEKEQLGGTEGKPESPVPLPREMIMKEDVSLALRATEKTGKQRTQCVLWIWGSRRSLVTLVG